MIIEVCCGSYEDAYVAKKAGANRVKLNSAMFLGGLTPSLGNLRLCKRNLDIPILPMIRPRSAGFMYTDYEYDTMVEDAQIFLENGADGIVFGFLNEDGTVNEERTRHFAALAEEKDAVFHRAFDVVPDAAVALETLIKCGIKRVLTSGLAPSVYDGMDVIKLLIKQADGRIEILPGAGLRATNIKHFVEYTGVDQVHFAAKETRSEPSVANNRSIYYGGALYPREDLVEVISPGGVAKVIGSI